MNSATVREPVIAPVASDDDEVLYEIIDGQRIGLPPMSVLSVWIASQLLTYIGTYGRTQDLGRVLSEALFHLPLPADRNRRPDLAFVSYQRWAKNRPLPPLDNAWNVLPNLVVEVVSPTDRAEDLLQKVAEYLDAGVTVVWVIYPRCQQVYVYESSTNVRALTRADELDGGTVLPGFRLQLGELFLEPAANGVAPDDA